MKKPTSRKPAVARNSGRSAQKEHDGPPIASYLAVPKHLSPEAAEWWRKIVADYEFEPADPGLLVLASALEAFDRMRAAQALVRRDGLTVSDRFDQVRAHPALKVEQDARASMARLIRQLGLDLEPLKAPGRPGGR